ncbi:MAG: hypothetical protein VW600_09665, partial [Ferrovibrio sp.]
MLFENMIASLDEFAGIDLLVIEQDFVMQMLSGAATGGTHGAELTTERNRLASLHANRTQVSIARFDAQAMVDFD